MRLVADCAIILACWSLTYAVRRLIDLLKAFAAAAKSEMIY